MKFSWVFPNQLDHPSSNQAGGNGTSALHVAAAGRDGDQAGQDAVAQGTNVVLVRDDISSCADIHPSNLLIVLIYPIYLSLGRFIRPSIHLHHPHPLPGLDRMKKHLPKSIF